MPTEPASDGKDRGRERTRTRTEGTELAIEFYCHILRTWAYLYYENMRLTCDVRAAPSPLVRARLSCLLCGLCSDGGFVPAAAWLASIGAEA